jgi:alkylmercury lyase
MALAQRPSIETIARRLLDSTPPLDDTDQRLSIALYRELAHGVPVTPSALAAKARLAADEVAARIASWPGVHYDADYRITAYWGLTLKPTANRLDVGGRDVFTWCAWDTLFLPALLGQACRVSSTCLATGEPIALVVSPAAVESAAPPASVLSFLLPDVRALRVNIIESFCRFVAFYSSPEAAQPWLDMNPEGFLLSLDEATEVGRRRLRARYPATWVL